MLEKNTTPLEGLKCLVLFSIELVIGNRTLKIMWILLAVAMWYLVGFNSMVLFILSLMLTLMICASILIFGFAYLASKRTD